MTDQEPQRKKGGRPRRHSPDAKRPTMSFRMGTKLHQLLIESASENERSLSEEIERRLEDTFQHANIVDAAANAAASVAAKSVTNTLSGLAGGPDYLSYGLIFGQILKTSIAKANEKHGVDVHWEDSEDKKKIVESEMLRAVTNIIRHATRTAA